jgi:hypothetical protein
LRVKATVTVIMNLPFLGVDAYYLQMEWFKVQGVAVYNERNYQRFAIENGAMMSYSISDIL